MASATGIPETTTLPREAVGEDEPLLGRAGDAAQQDGRPIYYNLVIGKYLGCEICLLRAPKSLYLSITYQHGSRHGSNSPSRHLPPHSFCLGLDFLAPTYAVLRTPPPQLRRPTRAHAIHPPPSANPHARPETQRHCRALHPQ